MSDPVKLPSGRYEVRYRDPIGRPRRRRFDTKGAAKDHLATVRTKGLEGSYIAPELGRLTFGQWRAQWWATKIDLRARTLTRYERDLRLHIGPRFDRHQLAKITRTEVQAWIADMRAAGVPDSAIRRRFSVFRKIMADAVADERIVKSPCRGVTLPQVRRLEIVVLTAEEVAQLAAAMPAWCRSFVWVAAYTGLRWSEMIGLRRRDVDLLRRRITVSRQIVEVGSRFRGFDEPKTDAGKRVVDLPPFLCEILEGQLERAQPGPDGLVFVNTRGNPPHLSSFTSQSWRRARAKIGRPDLRWHDLRHTAVALRIALGAHPKQIQETMGHSSITVTLDIYGNLFPTLGESVADGLEATYRAALAAGGTSPGKVTPLRALVDDRPR
ncbi:MAG TPA: site-specific integrase [Acidimicrobiales bacterium]|nr:site-specific integrase [Acidimicrobiales bacterium]